MAVVSDRYSAYRWIDPAQREACWSLLTREFQALADRDGRVASLDRALTAGQIVGAHGAREDAALRFAALLGKRSGGTRTDHGARYIESPPPSVKAAPRWVVACTTTCLPRSLQHSTAIAPHHRCPPAPDPRLPEWVPPLRGSL
jgi:hypothetical protein